MNRIQLLRTAWCCFATLLTVGAAFGAESYPSRPVRVVAPYPPGSSADVMGKWKKVVDAAGIRAD